jgi:cobalt-precorrin-5B (C1)-methyltransferase
MGTKKLREGFTTGTAAAAAAKGAVLCLGGLDPVQSVLTPLPNGERWTIPVERVEKQYGGVRVTVIKDAGDDPDVTHRAMIRTTVHILNGRDRGKVTIGGGKGVGRVTRPGLPVPVGQPAINPVPLHQIEDAVREGLEETGMEGAVFVTVEVMNGESIAEKTLNPRLGIVGGISILGTRGTVKPFSHEAYEETIRVSMDVAKAQGLETIALSTGGKSENLLRGHRPDLPESTFIQVADYFRFSLEEAAKFGFQTILYACFFGKLVKMAQRHPYTHARKSPLDFKKLAQWARETGIREKKVARINDANTAREVRELVLKDPRGKAFLEDVSIRAMRSARRFAGKGPTITCFLFDFDGKLLATRTDNSRVQG